MDKRVGALAGLVGDYGSDSSGDEAECPPPPPNISEPMWSMCVDPGSGFPYYWEQVTNTVSWEPPPGVILPPPSHLTVSTGMIPLQSMKPPTNAPAGYKRSANAKAAAQKELVTPRVESSSEEEDERIELITSYHNSGSESDEDESKKKSILAVYPASSRHKAKKKMVQKSDIKGTQKNNATDKKSYGPQLPKKLDNEVTLGPELPKKGANVIQFGPELPSKPEASVQFGPELPKHIEINPKYDNMSSIIDGKPIEFGPELPSDLVAFPANEKVNDKEPKTVENNGLYDGESFNKGSTAPSFGNIAETPKDNPPPIGKRSDIEENSNNEDCVNTETDNLEDLMHVKSQLLKKLGDLVPSEVQYLIGSPKSTVASGNNTPKRVKSPKTPPGSPPPPPKTTAALDMDVDDLIAQIEKEQPIDQPLITSDASETIGSVESTSNKSPTLLDDTSQPKSDLPFKPLFPSVNNMDNSLPPAPEVVPMNNEQIKINSKPTNESVADKQADFKVTNKYETDFTALEGESVNFKRKRRIALDVLPAKKTEPGPVQNVSYTTKYGETFDISSGRMGLGFKPDLNVEEIKGNSNPYANFKKGNIMFQKGESLNPTLDDEEQEEKNEDVVVDEKSLEDKKNVIEGKLKFLTQSFPPIPPLQQMYIEMQVMWNAWMSGNVGAYLQSWITTAGEELQRLEVGAAPPNWTCTFSSESGCYVYQHMVSGERTTQYPLQATADGIVGLSTASTVIATPEDMDICTTPPPAAVNSVPAVAQPVVIQPIIFSTMPSEPLPPGTVSPPPPPPSSPPPPPPTPPPPPPPPYSPPPPPPPEISPEPPPPPLISQRDMQMASKYQKMDYANSIAPPPPPPSMDPLHAVLDSFYSDLASLDTTEFAPPQDADAAQNPPLPPPAPVNLYQQSIQNAATFPNSSPSTASPVVPASGNADDQSDKREKKKKTKTKISSGYHHRGVNSLVAKWKKVQESLD